MYPFTYGGKNGTTFQLTESKDLVVVRTREAVALQRSISSQARAALPGMLPVAAFPEANVTVYKCIGTQAHSAEVARNVVRRTLKEEKSVRFAGRVLKDPKSGAIVVYTENLYVQFEDRLTKKACRAVLDSFQLKVKEDLGLTAHSYFVEAPGSGLEVFRIAEAVLHHPDVVCCHPELVRERRFKAAYPLQWYLKETHVNGVLINQHVQAEEAWKFSKGRDVTIAVLDDGVDMEHEEFAGKIVHPRDTILNTDDANPKHPADMHGTACAGVACGSGKKKASGVAPAANLMPIRIGSIGSISEAKAFKWAADHGADVISCSWGPMDGAWWNPNDPLHFSRSRMPDSAKAAIDYAIRNGRNGKGCVITWAAGNGNEDVKYDEYASYDKVIAVAACNDQGKRSVYSDFGDAICCCFPSNDFDAPFFNHPKPLTRGVWTTDRTGDKGYNSGGFDMEEVIGDVDGKYTATFGGTSSACPGVAGIAGLMLEVNPSLSWQEVKEIMKHSCDRIDEAFGNYDGNGHSLFYGYGRLNAWKAVKNAEAAGTQKPGADVFRMGGWAQFNKRSNVQLAAGGEAGAFDPPQRFLGFQLQIEPFHPDLQIVSKVLVRNLEASTGGVGEYCGTHDKRRSVVGISCKLEGRLSTRFDVKYAVKCKSEDKWRKAKNGAWAGSSDKKKGNSVEAVRVELVKRPE